MVTRYNFGRQAAENRRWKAEEKRKWKNSSTVCNYFLPSCPSQLLHFSFSFAVSFILSFFLSPSPSPIASVKESVVHVQQELCLAAITKHVINIHEVASTDNHASSQVTLNPSCSCFGAFYQICNKTGL